MPAPAIKICGITTPEALDACLRAGVEYIGLNFFAKSPRCIGIEQAAAFSVQARARTKVVGLFVDPENGLIDAVRQSVTLDVIQLHGSERPEQVAQIRAQNGLETWKAVGIRKREDFAAARTFIGSAHRILYDAKPPEGAEMLGGTGLRIDWSLFAGQDHALPWILAGGLNARNVAEAVDLTGAELVDTASGVESALGVKDAGQIAAFVKAVRGH